MDYERIHKLQTGIISPSKLRMKLLGPHHHKKKDGSNSNSSRTSPSRPEDAEFVKNSLLASESDHLDVEVPSSSLEVLSLKPSGDQTTSREPKETTSRKNGDVGRLKMQNFLKIDSTIHPMKTTEDESLDYDSNASSSSFEFHKGERTVNNPATRSLLRPIPSKWNDAEKWIMNRQNMPPGYSKKNASQNQENHLAATTMPRAAPESANYQHKLPIGKDTDTKRVGFCQSAPSETRLISGEAHQRNPAMDSFPQSKDLKEVNELNLSCSTSTDCHTDIPGIRSVAMRDMGTEMTPMTSQEPSRTATPVDSTPLRSPTSSMPSTPRGIVPAPTPLDSTTDRNTQFAVESNKRPLTEEEMKLKTRREIAALGMQLGKMNIAAWASKGEEEKRESPGGRANEEEHKRIEFEKRAAAWEEAEKSKHTARYKREEIKIQAWESQKKAKLEAEMRRMEAKVEQMRAQTQAKMVKKIAMARQRSEEKRAAAEALRNQEAERTAAKAEYIRQTGQMPSSKYICCVRRKGSSLSFSFTAVYGTIEHIQESWNVMFIRIASRQTKCTEEVVVFGVRNYMNSKSTIKLKPLRSFPPVSQMDMRKHAPAISPASITRRVIIRINKAEGRASEVLVNSREVIDRDAAL
ncbi:microtubule-associated protein futsch [Senna tora]|uniref:Microtubule-associated protein futsch n=1 Tax=Senna tora TaxID=362788 RepID=A0A834SI42_9FABA|nr:microtubule-associated protein futsch [Senna tora]